MAHPRRLTLLALGGLLLMLGPAGTAAAGSAGPVGEQRLLVLPVTWGPRPWELDEIRREAIEATGEWIRRASFGRATLSGMVAPWLEVDHSASDCDPVRLARKARAAAANRGVVQRGYDRFLILHPRVACAWSGFAGGDELWLNGVLRSKVVVHELGHTWGLDHANSLECGADGCRGVEYGDLYSPMGRGSADFTAFEKFRLGWITDIAEPAAPEGTTVELGPLERPSILRQTFVAHSAGGQFWLEYRNGIGVLVHADATPDGTPMSSQPNLLVMDAAGSGRPALAAGERLAVQGAFTVTVASLSAEAARLEFAWTDRTPPRAPRIRMPGRIRAESGRLVVRWRGLDERGSGLSHFDVSVQGRSRRAEPDVLGLEQELSFPMPDPGRHTIAVTAVDRAGNRRSATRRVVVVGRRPARAFRKKIDVGGYRLYLECRGAGSPTVVFDAGLNETGGSWSPIHPMVARQTRACAYDRAGLGGSDRRPRKTPVTTAEVVEELRALLRGAGIPGPYVLVGHSLGGFTIRLHAARYPSEAAGLVFVDAADPELLRSRGLVFDGQHQLDVRPAVDEVLAARFGSTPMVVLFSGLGAAAGDIARRSSNRSLVFARGSGHHIHQDRPRLVAEAIRQVVGAARAGAPLRPCRDTALPRLGGECRE